MSGSRAARAEARVVLTLVCWLRPRTYVSFGLLSYSVFFFLLLFSSFFFLFLTYFFFFFLLLLFLLLPSWKSSRRKEVS